MQSWGQRGDDDEKARSFLNTSDKSLYSEGTLDKPGDYDWVSPL